jgi:plasmid stabilization system protein ParE
LEAATGPVKAFRLTAQAKDDLFDIWIHIAPDSVEAADRLEAAIIDSCQRLAERPDIGHFRRDLTEKPVRFFPVRLTYLIVYNPASEPLQILRILHGARDVPPLLEE